jgi:hypothetical protein
MWLQASDFVPQVSHAIAAAAAAAGNLLRGGDQRGYNSLAKMYTIDHAMGSNAKTAA